MLNVREIQRGQVWWVDNDDDDDDNFVTKKRRPGVIVSSPIGCETSPVVTVVYLTTQPRDDAIHPQIYNTGKKSWALCEQITTVDKSRLDTYFCSLTDFEMEKIEQGIHTALGLVAAKSSQDNEIRALQEEKAQVESEVKLWRRLYDKTMDQLVELKFNSDLVSRSEKRTRSIPVLRMAPEEMHSDSDDEPGSTKDVKVNINLASAVEISEKTGLSKTVAYAITGYRKRNGRFGSVDDLMKAKKFTEHHMQKYGDRFVV